MFGKKEKYLSKEIEMVLGIEDEILTVKLATTHPFAIVCSKCPVMKGNRLVLEVDLINKKIQKIIASEYIDVTDILRDELGEKSLAELAKVKKILLNKIVGQIEWKK